MPTTPTARSSSNSSDSACTWVSTVRLGRSITGCRYPTAALARAPFRCVTWYQPTPSCSAPLKSSFAARPVAAAESRNAWASGLRERPSDTESGPPAPWYSSSPRSLSSESLK